MRLSLKNYRTSRGDEGDAFSATLFVDGKRVGEAYYDGNGGEYRYEFDITPNGKIPREGIPTFTPAHRALRDKNKNLFGEAVRDDAQTLGLYGVVRRDGGDGGWDIVLEEIINLAQAQKSAKAWAKKKGKPVVLVASPPFSVEYSRADYPVYEFGGNENSYAIGLLPHVDQVIQRHPQSKITAFDWNGNYLGIVHVGTDEKAWAAKYGKTVTDTVKGRRAVLDAITGFLTAKAG